MIESYLTVNERLTEVLREKEELESVVKESQLCAVNERKLRDWIGECVRELEHSGDEFVRMMNNDRYWEEKMEEKGSGCIIVMEVVRLMRKYAECMNKHNLLQHESNSTIK